MNILQRLVQQWRQRQKAARQRGDNSGEFDPPWAYQHEANGEARGIEACAAELMAVLADLSPAEAALREAVRLFDQKMHPGIVGEMQLLHAARAYLAVLDAEET